MSSTIAWSSRGYNKTAWHSVACGTGSSPFCDRAGDVGSSLVARRAMAGTMCAMSEWFAPALSAGEGRDSKDPERQNEEDRPLQMIDHDVLTGRRKPVGNQRHDREGGRGGSDAADDLIFSLGSDNTGYAYEDQQDADPLPRLDGAQRVAVEKPDRADDGARLVDEERLGHEA